VVIPLLFFGFLHVVSIKPYPFLEKWRRLGWSYLGYFCHFSALLAVTHFILDNPGFIESWELCAQILVLFGISTFIFLKNAFLYSSPKMGLTTELYLGLFLGLLRWKLDALNTMELGSPLDGYLLLGAAFIAAGVREVLRRTTGAFDRVLTWSGSIYGVLGLAVMLFIALRGGGGLHGELGSLLLAGLCYWQSKTRHKGNLILTTLFLNTAIVLFYMDMHWTHLQLFVFPIVISLLTLAQVFKEELSKTQLQGIRLTAGLALIGVSSFYNMIDFQASLLYPLSAAGVALLGVLCGISLRIRIYLFMGLGAFVFNTFAVLVHVIKNQPPDHIQLYIGCLFLLAGLFFTGSFLLFQMQRQMILLTVQNLKANIQSWE